MDCSLPGSSVHGIFQARVLEWVAIAFSLNNLGEENRCNLDYNDHQEIIEKMLGCPMRVSHCRIFSAGGKVEPGNSSVWRFFKDGRVF